MQGNVNVHCSCTAQSAQRRAPATAGSPPAPHLHLRHTSSTSTHKPLLGSLADTGLQLSWKQEPSELTTGYWAPLPSTIHSLGCLGTVPHRSLGRTVTAAEPGTLLPQAEGMLPAHGWDSKARGAARRHSQHSAHWPAPQPAASTAPFSCHSTAICTRGNPWWPLLLPCSSPAFPSLCRATSLKVHSSSTHQTACCPAASRSPACPGCPGRAARPQTGCCAAGKSPGGGGSGRGCCPSARCWTSPAGAVPSGRSGWGTAGPAGSAPPGSACEYSRSSGNSRLSPARFSLRAQQQQEQQQQASLISSSVRQHDTQRHAHVSTLEHGLATN